MGKTYKKEMREIEAWKKQVEMRGISVYNICLHKIKPWKH